MLQAGGAGRANVDWELVSDGEGQQSSGQGRLRHRFGVGKSKRAGQARGAAGDVPSPNASSRGFMSRRTWSEGWSGLSSEEVSSRAAGMVRSWPTERLT